MNKENKKEFAPSLTKVNFSNDSSVGLVDKDIFHRCCDSLRGGESSLPQQSVLKLIACFKDIYAHI